MISGLLVQTCGTDYNLIVSIQRHLTKAVSIEFLALSLPCLVLIVLTLADACYDIIRVGAEKSVVVAGWLNLRRD